MGQSQPNISQNAQRIIYLMQTIMRWSSSRLRC